MKFGQLIVFIMRNILLDKSYTKSGGETIPRPYSKKPKLSASWIKCIKFYAVCFNCMPIVCYRNILKWSCTPLTFTSYKAFLKNKKRSRTSLTASFSAWLLKKNIYLVVFYQISLCGFLYFVEYWAICVLQ